MQTNDYVSLQKALGLGWEVSGDRMRLAYALADQQTDEAPG